MIRRNMGLFRKTGLPDLSLTNALFLDLITLLSLQGKVYSGVLEGGL